MYFPSKWSLKIYILILGDNNMLRLIGVDRNYSVSYPVSQDRIVLISMASDNHQF